MANRLVEGRVKFFSVDKGFGFIITSEGGELYFRISDVVGGVVFSSGDQVEFYLAQGRKGPKAVSVRRSFSWKKTVKLISDEKGCLVIEIYRYRFGDDGKKIFDENFSARKQFYAVSELDEAGLSPRLKRKAVSMLEEILAEKQRLEEAENFLREAINDLWFNPGEVHSLEPMEKIEIVSLPDDRKIEVKISTFLGFWERGICFAQTATVDNGSLKFWVRQEDVIFSGFRRLREGPAPVSLETVRTFAERFGDPSSVEVIEVQNTRYPRSQLKFSWGEGEIFALVEFSGLAKDFPVEVSIPEETSLVQISFLHQRVHQVDLSMVVSGEIFGHRFSIPYNKGKKSVLGPHLDKWDDHYYLRMPKRPENLSSEVWEEVMSLFPSLEELRQDFQIQVLEYFFPSLEKVVSEELNGEEDQLRDYFERRQFLSGFVTQIRALVQHPCRMAEHVVSWREDTSRIKNGVIENSSNLVVRKYLALEFPPTNSQKVGDGSLYWEHIPSSFFGENGEIPEEFSMRDVKEAVLAKLLGYLEEGLQRVSVILDEVSRANPEGLPLEESGTIVPQWDQYRSLPSQLRQEWEEKKEKIDELIVVLWSRYQNLKSLVDSCDRDPYDHRFDDLDQLFYETRVRINPESVYGRHGLTRSDYYPDRAQEVLAEIEDLVSQLGAGAINNDFGNESSCEFSPGELEDLVFRLMQGVCPVCGRPLEKWEFTTDGRYRLICRNGDDHEREILLKDDDPYYDVLLQKVISVSGETLAEICFYGDRRRREACSIVISFPSEYLHRDLPEGWVRGVSDREGIQVVDLDKIPSRWSKETLESKWQNLSEEKERLEKELKSLRRESRGKPGRRARTNIDPVEETLDQIQRLIWKIEELLGWD